jgi:hypothetical protein
MKADNSTSSTKWPYLLVLLALLGWCCVSSWFSAAKDLSYLAKTTGALKSSEVVVVQTKSPHYGVVIGLEGTTEKFGVKTGPARQDALDFQAGLELGEEITIYHEAPELLPYANINYDIFQLENHRGVLLPLSRVHQGNQGNFALSLVAFFIVAVLVLNEYLKKRSSAQADF